MRPRRRGIVSLVIAIVLLVMIAPVCAAVGLVVGVGNGLDGITGTAPLASGATYHATAGQAVTIFAFQDHTDAGNGVASGSGPAGSTCQVRDADGQQVDVRPNGAMRITRNGTRYAESGEFLPDTSGDYTITCASGPALVLDSEYAGHLVKRIFVTVAVAVGGAVLIGLIGLVALVIGIVRLTRSNREIRDFDRAHGIGYAGGPGYGPPPPGYGPPPPGYGPK